MSSSLTEQFGDYFPDDQDKVKAAWRTGMLVLDANILLSVYRWEEHTRTDFFSLVKEFDGRVFVPFQAASEFHRNRIKEIRAVRATFLAPLKPLDEAIKVIKGNSEKIRALVGHDEVLRDLEVVRFNAERTLKAKRSEHPDLEKDDVLLRQLESDLGQSIGRRPSSQVLALRYELADRRFANLVPPGFADAGKGGVSKYGDALLWFEIIDLAKAREVPIILVTNDEKEDWCMMRGGAVTGPRPELSQELMADAGVEFYLYNSDVFMRKAAALIGVAVSEESVLDSMNGPVHMSAPSVVPMSVVQSVQGLRLASMMGQIDLLNAVVSFFEARGNYAQLFAPHDVCITGLKGSEDGLPENQSMYARVFVRENTNLRVREFIDLTLLPWVRLCVDNNVKCAVVIAVQGYVGNGIWAELGEDVSAIRDVCSGNGVALFTVRAAGSELLEFRI